MHAPEDDDEIFLLSFSRFHAGGDSHFATEENNNETKMMNKAKLIYYRDEL